MARAIGVEGLSDAIEKILAEYGDEVVEKSGEVVEKVGRKAVKALKEESHSTFKGDEYYKGWSVTFDEDRFCKTAIIHNRKLPGLPHLLEHGHAKRGGGRVAGRVHIKPVETEMIESFEDTLRREL